MAQGKKIIRYTFIAILAILLFFIWRIFGSNTNFEENKKTVFIKTGSRFNQVETELDDKGVVTHTRSFRRLAKLLNYNKNIIPGKYVFEKGSSIYTVLKTLKSGRQTPVMKLLSSRNTIAAASSSGVPSRFKSVASTICRRSSLPPRK